MEAPAPPTRILIVGQDFGALPASLLAGASVTRCDPGQRDGWPQGGLRCDEDRLPFAPASFDLVLAGGTLDTLHDVPGALILMRRALAPGGRFFGAMLGSGSLPLLRQIVYTGDGPHAPRLHPQIDVRAAGDLLARAGFAEPVADMDSVVARYAQWDRYRADLRANGIGNCLRTRQPLQRAQLSLWASVFVALHDDEGRVSETFCPVYMSGTVPAASQARSTSAMG